MVANPYSSRGLRELRQMAEMERGRHLATGREILLGPDTPGRRWLIGVLCGDPQAREHGTAGPNCQHLIPPIIDRIREQLITEFPSLFLKEQE